MFVDFLDDIVPEYKLPFEEEVGVHRSLSDIRDCVARDKKRPKINPQWKNDPVSIGNCSDRRRWTVAAIFSVI